MSDARRPPATALGAPPPVPGVGSPTTAGGRRTPEQVKASARARRSQKKGASGQQAAMNHLVGLGFGMVTEIPTKMRKIGKIWRHTKKAEGDIRAVAPGGISVLAEVKTYDVDRLPYSELDDHQPRNLQRHQDLGGLSLLIWVTPVGVLVLPWDELGAFRPGTSIPLATAQRMRWTKRLEWPSPPPVHTVSGP